jgi:thioredoxin reductase (NADPH)
MILSYVDGCAELRSSDMHRMFALLLLCLCSLQVIETGSNGIAAEYFSFHIDSKGEIENVVPLLIIGGGQAGYAAAIYAGRANMPVVLLTGGQPGGQLVGSSAVENIPGLDVLPGWKISERLHEQAHKFGAKIIYDTVAKVDFSKWPYEVYTDGGLHINALSVVIATGASARLLDVPGEKEYFGKGISTCAVCDALFYRDKDVFIVGGGDSAMEQAELLVPYARSITILVRTNELRSAPKIFSRVMCSPKISIVYNKRIIEVLGDEERLIGLRLQNVKTGEIVEMEAGGLFLAIGHNPNTQLFADYLQMNSQGYIHLGSRNQETSVRGIFAAGDVCDNLYRQAVVAAGEGAKAALDALKFLRDEVGITDYSARQLKLHHCICGESDMLQSD